MIDQRSNREAVFKQLQSILMDLLKVRQEKDPGNRQVLSWDTDLVDDLGIDSVETLDLLNVIEDRFDINPDIHEVNSLRKVHEIVDYVVQLQQKKKAR